MPIFYWGMMIVVLLTIIDILNQKGNNHEKRK